ncbi:MULTISPECIES: MarR family winged helix-turn-helix transcriptional regulator [unclassified Mycobacterium]|uniref:MarR family winged helix-turn-helix transcriptional regulator n=1 Tax=unclassified Mycobacterium TaxID=2642494 RepID=UPI0029C92C62|nr:MULTISPECIES: MarR family transcriptional regulator [unclassified Mycobacterium]
MTEPTSTATLLFAVHRAAETKVMEALRAAGFDDLTVAQCRIAQRLSPTGIRVTDLAEQAGVTKQTAGGLIDELERTGYVVRHPDPADARARLVVLTARGMKLCAASAAEVNKIEDEWRNEFGATAYRQLRTMLMSLREVTDPME